MAADILNTVNRKRKSGGDCIFEVNEEDVSPPSSPEPETLSEPVNIVENDVNSKSLPLKTNTDSANLEIVATVQEEVEEISVQQSNKDGNKVQHVFEKQVHETKITNNFEKPVSVSKHNENKIKRTSRKPLFSIKFRDKDTIKKYKSIIIKSLKSLLESQLKEETNEPELEVNFWEDVPCNNNNTDVANNLFIVDTTPTKNTNNERLPRYLTKKCEAIDDEINVIEDVKETPVNKRAPQNICFNCEGDHGLRDCTKTRDYKRITAARNKFKANTSLKSVRYHLDEEQKFCHLVPGKISENLRLLLNLRKYEVPSYIYRMRTLGYPPGWLESAKITKSNLELFDFHGTSIDNSECNEELIDPDKIIEYPGFNVPFEKGFKDDYKYYGCPPYSENFSKDAMIRYLKKLHLLYTTSTPVSSTVVVTESLIPIPMDISDDNCNSDSQDSEGQLENEERKSHEPSPTLNDLELRKKQLLELLEDGTSTSSPQTPSNQEDTNKSLTTIKASTFGTPILKNYSPYERLPCSDNFSKDISQVINFENLPNSTGKYEQMSQVIHKVRKVIKNNFEEQQS